MTFDYYAHLHSCSHQTDKTDLLSKQVNEAGLASGFVDRCTAWSYQDKQADKNEARLCYMKKTTELNNQNFKFPENAKGTTKNCFLLPDYFEPDFSNLLDPTWFGINVSFNLESPWYSKDDRPFHVLDNPVRKDRVFGMPFMSAASWKGLLRWACRMQAGLYGHLGSHDMKMNDWRDPPWILHLFGNEKGEDEQFRSGTLACHPTWFDKIAFEVINPHSRVRRAGTQPIYYEVVPTGTKGNLRLLYAPLPGEIERDNVKPSSFIEAFIDSIHALLETYGISAKRTAGWGTAKIDEWTAMFKPSAQPPKAETGPAKGTPCSPQDPGTPEQEQTADCVTKDAEEFKDKMKKQLLEREKTDDGRSTS